MQQSIDRGHLKTQDVTRRFNNVQFQVIVLWDTITILSNYRSIEDIQDYIKEYILPIPHIRLYGTEYLFDLVITSRCKIVDHSDHNH